MVPNPILQHLFYELNKIELILRHLRRIINLLSKANFFIRLSNKFVNPLYFRPIVIKLIPL